MGERKGPKPHLIYFSYGMTKCGSTLAYKLTQRIFRDNAWPQKPLPPEVNGDFGAGFVQDLGEAAIDRLVTYAEPIGKPIVVKTHQPASPAVSALFHSGRAFGHAVFRDPREMALSMLDHGSKSRQKGRIAFADLHQLEDTLDRIENQIRHLEKWLRLPGVMPWFYDDFAFDHKRALRRLKTQLRLKGEPEEMLAKFDATQAMQYNKARPERWREEMTAEESAMFLTRFEVFYRRMVRGRRSWRDPFLGHDETLRRPESKAA